jgi:hypothetical protein
MKITVNFKDDVYAEIKNVYTTHSVSQGQVYTSEELDVLIIKKMKQSIKNEILGIKRELMEQANELELTNLSK